jgi:hypothetical protein
MLHRSIIRVANQIAQRKQSIGERIVLGRSDAGVDIRRRCGTAS